MKTRIESSNKHPSIKYKLDYRTDEELVESIRKKRSKNLPLDEKEAELVRKQAEEDHEETTSLYRR
ncbi:MAG: hypothetical protein US45_C0019G0006 [Candidatus Nomurabacteria bacterium GW2011_GWA1_37_20]|uniref:Uncharacterized protein n=2 Tax=Parcubacteria group TaxID=1794811 RepID=A0A0G0I4F2_9BACT|nr:MAG: hypothetical protein US33_C0024G0006 [Parcubacteria group bacterium GW2011_GWC1_36_9]KKQ26913.1 MAG: hypothetical protein US41_C0028G0012 [Parcubacteria group bacterium GW2011_GWB1_37_13]KKQ32457.1 MAG: hypothetical protein US45_C0019G0006 [Candidatus Nomurabacteria bacterium GW2011_GWA1_37_20]KKQ45840.1 MAG: hypothetical protein US65_C0048G0012 [Candidatus Yanofskybacteria bacterium GW2011_GWC2_37_9]